MTMQDITIALDHEIIVPEGYDPQENIIEAMWDLEPLLPLFADDDEREMI